MTSSRPDRRLTPARLWRALQRLLGYGLIYPLSKLVPRRSDLWLFGHQDGAFAGNSKYLYLWLRLHRPDIKAFWITGDEGTYRFMQRHGLAVCRRASLRGSWLSLRSAVHFFCHGPEDVNLPFAGGALLVNLWHGVGLKACYLGHRGSDVSRVARERPSGLRRVFELPYLLRPDLVVSTSPFMQRHFAEQFDLPASRCPTLGYPRLDAASDRALEEFLQSLPGSERDALWEDGVEEVYAYVPTYRDSSRDFLSAALPDLPRLEGALARRGAVMYVKLHRHTKASSWTGGSRVRLWPDELDLSASIPALTGLITDYSSVHYDYIFNRATGSILYTFDSEDYVSADRELLYPIEGNTAGWRATTFDELVELIGSGAALLPHPDVSAVRETFWGKSDGPASERIVAHVEGLLASRRASARSAVAPQEVAARA
jgi:CDP-glycerol glycerophosphotransferase (TagB/SpsB family)